MLRRVIFTGILIMLAVTLCQADTLVFRNGNRMEVEELQIDDRHVVYTVRGMTVKIPVRYIDLEETMKLRQEAEARRREEEAARRHREERLRQMDAPEPSMEDLATRSFQDGAVKDIIDQWRKHRESLDVPAAGPVAVEMPPDKETYSLPFHKEQGVQMISGVLNGTARVKFVFDTGATYTILSPATARAAGLVVDPSCRVPIRTASGDTIAHCGVVRRLQFGQLVVQNLEVLVVPWNDVNLLGQNFISLFDVGIDYAGMEIKLHRKKSPAR